MHSQDSPSSPSALNASSGRTREGSTDPRITDLLRAWSDGRPGALRQLMPLVYQRLHELAAGLLTGERRDHTLQPSALVHETFLRLVRLESMAWADRAHFFALCARFMRRILVDHARRSAADKRGAARVLLPLHGLDREPVAESGTEILALNDALASLRSLDPVQFRIVELRYFGGLDREQIATVLGISSATVTRRWRMARAWLAVQLADEVRAPGS